MNPRIGLEKDVKHTQGSTIDHLRTLMWNTHNVKYRAPNFKANTQASMYDQTAMEGFRKTNSYGYIHLKNYIEDLYQKKTGPGIPPGDVLYYKKQMLHGPFGKYIQDRVYKAEIFFRHQSAHTGNTGDLNNRSLASTPIYDYTTKVNSENIVTQTKIPRSMYNTIHSMRRSTRGLIYRNIFGSLRLDNTLPLVDKKFSTRLSQEKTGTYGTQSHGQRMTADVNRYEILTKKFEQELIKTSKPIKTKKYVTQFSGGAVGGSKGTSNDRTAKEDDVEYSGCCEPCIDCYGIEGGCEPGSGLIWDFYQPHNIPKGKCVGNGQFTNDWEVYRFLKLFNPFSSQNQQGASFSGTVQHKMASDEQRKYQSVQSGSVSKGSEVNYTGGVVSTDLQGNPYETDARRAIKVAFTPGGKSVTLHTVPGAMGHIR